jgi:hypothetical protein
MVNSGEQLGPEEPTKATRGKVSGVFRHLIADHAEVFASAKRLGMRVREFEPRDAGVRDERASHDRDEMVEVYAALREVVSSDDDPPSSDLADAMAALDAINPSSPEWGPTFLQVSELLEARVCR